MEFKSNIEICLNENFNNDQKNVIFKSVVNENTSKLDKDRKTSSSVFKILNVINPNDKQTSKQKNSYNKSGSNTLKSKNHLNKKLKEEFIKQKLDLKSLKDNEQENTKEKDYFQFKPPTGSIFKIELKPAHKEHLSKICNPNIDYLSFKFQNIIYNKGDFIMINEENDEYSIGKILEIVNSNGNEKITYWPMIKVQWFYRKKDINRDKNNLNNKKKFDSISDFEVFKSRHSDNICIESIISKCKVLTFDEYEANEEVGADTFFSRHGYDASKQLLEPTFDKWEKECKCLLPLNPDQLYIKCEECSKWFHPECCGYLNEELENLYFICYKCTRTIKNN